MNNYLDLKSNSRKFIGHGFFFSIAYHVAEPSTILPLIVGYFSQNNILIGLFSSLVRGGTVLMQLFMAFFAQSYKKVLKPLKWLFMLRLISWLIVGFSLYMFGSNKPVLTLWLVGAGLFSFSFFAGFGTILFHELLGKLFSHNYRGITWANRQIFMAIGGISSAFITSWMFRRYEPPRSFAIAFLVSFCFMATGYIILSTVKEEEKLNISARESNFLMFFKNIFITLREDKTLNKQVIVCIFSYSYLFVLPFIIKNKDIGLKISGLALGSVVPLLTGGIAGNLIWKKFSSQGNDKKIIQTSFLLIIIALLFAFNTKNIYQFVFIYILTGAATDGFRLAFKNLVLSIAPENKRPVYFAIQNNITSLGMFFSIPGGWILQNAGIDFLLFFSIILLFIGFIMSFSLKNYKIKELK